jgi:PPOX class probable F420-dependent enzyme
VDQQLQRALRAHAQLFGSYTRTGSLKQVPVWLTVREGVIEFLTASDSAKVKRLSRNPRVTCTIGGSGGPVLPGSAQVVNDDQSRWRTYRAYWKTHPLMMILVSLMIRRKMKDGSQVLVRVVPDAPNPLDGVTDPE